MHIIRAYCVRYSSFRRGMRPRPILLRAKKAWPRRVRDRHGREKSQHHHRNDMYSPELGHRSSGLLSLQRSDARLHVGSIADACHRRQRLRLPTSDAAIGCSSFHTSNIPRRRRLFTPTYKLVHCHVHVFAFRTTDVGCLPCVFIAKTCRRCIPPLLVRGVNNLRRPIPSLVLRPNRRRRRRCPQHGSPNKLHRRPMSGVLYADMLHRRRRSPVRAVHPFSTLPNRLDRRHLPRLSFVASLSL